MESDFLCVVCKQLPDSIYECLQCGAPHCYKCCVVDKNKCKECRSYEFQISVFGNMALNNIEVKCPKCKVLFAKNDLKSHIENECKAIVLKCLFEDCGKSFSKNEMAMHLLNTHELEVVEFFEGDIKIPTNLSMVTPSIANTKLKDTPSFNYFHWFNNSNVYKHDQTKMFTFSSKESYNGYWKAKIFIKKCQHPGYMVLGIISRPFKEYKGYLGGDLGHGSWGLAGNGALGEHGKWKHDKKYNEGDIVEIIYNKGYINYTINGEVNGYNFKFGENERVYLAATCYYKDTCFVILDW